MDNRAVADPRGIKDQNFITGIGHGGDSGIERPLGARRDHNLAGLYAVDIVFAGQLGADRFEQGRCAKSRGIVGVPFANGGKAGLNNVGRGVKIGFTTGQVDHVKAGRFFLAPLLHHHGRG